MASTFQVVDSDDLSTVLWDFNGVNTLPDGTTTTCAFGVGGTLNLGSPSTEFTRFSPTSAAGGSTAFQRDPLVESSFRLRCYSASYDGLAAGVGELSRLLANGGVIKWIPNGSANTRYIDFEPSFYPALFDGMAMELHHVINQFDTPEGVLITFTRQPYLRGPLLAAASNVVVNSPMILDATTGDKNPDGWAWDSEANITGTTYSTTNESWTNTLATTSDRNLQQTTGAAACAAAEVWTYSFDACAASSNARVTATVRFMDNGNTPLGTLQSGTRTTLSTSWQRVYVTTAAAPATTDRAQLSYLFQNSAATSTAIYVRNAKMEKSASVGQYVGGGRTIDGDPAATISGGRVLAFWNVGTVPAEVKLLTNGRISFVIGARSRQQEGKRGLVDYLNVRRVIQCEDMTNGANSTDAADANASAGTAVQNDWAGTAIARPLAAHLTHSFNTLMDSVEGYFDVYVRVRASAAGPMTGTFQLTYGMETGGTDTNSLVAVSYSLTDAYTAYNLGRIYVPDSAEGLYLSLRASRTSTPDLDLFWDCVTFVPAENMTAVVTPTGDTPSSSAYTELSPDGAWKTNASYAREGLASVAGPRPLTLPPGLSIIHLGAKHATIDALTDTDVLFTYHPRYLN